ncbi:fibrous sheath CABYR-binding protein [Hippoglossus stenolepis]|uniref:fibrous sheath CABYR-binding protein n=1 Tax=Hippoglossus stenolepis TaxID=195615 RepID=UPI00159C308F|nr:fibrous sheath CABYR-binding protein [Hippoglossus stenolepis]
MMENPEQDGEPLPSFIQTISEMLNAGVKPEPHQEPEPESNQETSESLSGPLQLEHMESRRRQLRNRQVILQKIQQLRKTPGDDSDRSTNEVTSEDSDEVCELENIQKELQELLLNKLQLETQMENVTHTANRGREDKLSIIYKTEPPCGGIYTLPPLPPTQENTIEEMSEETTPAEETPIGRQDELSTLHKTEPPCEEIYTLPPPQLTQENTIEEMSVETTPAEETPIGPIVPVESLLSMQAFTRCPSCGEAVFTEIRSVVGETIWMLCCVCSMLGCVAGCCLIPFFMENVKDIHHRCPRCQAHIHTYQHL